MKNIYTLINHISKGQSLAIEELCLRIDPTKPTAVNVTDTARHLDIQGHAMKPVYVRDAFKLLAIAEIIEYHNRGPAGNIITVIDQEMFKQLCAHYGITH